MMKSVLLSFKSMFFFVLSIRTRVSSHKLLSSKIDSDKIFFDRNNLTTTHPTTLFTDDVVAENVWRTDDPSMYDDNRCIITLSVKKM